MKKTLLLTFFLFLGITTVVHSQACGEAFTDPAGATVNYANNSDYTITICPTNPGEVVTVTFTAFSTEVNYDALYVFNGTSIAAPQIASSNGASNVPGSIAGGYWGTTLPGPFTSTSADGCLTFRFRSDGSVSNPGWIANVTCAPPPSCSIPSALASSELTYTSTVLSWTQPPNPDTSVATAWECLVLPFGSPIPTATVTGFISASVDPYTISGLASNTCYTFYVRALCSATEKSDWSLGSNFCTLIAPPVCGGQFVDNGGANANYANNSNATTTICPWNPTDVVTVSFASFYTEANWDALYVYDGSSISSSQIPSSNGAGNVPGGLAGGYWGTTIPGPFTSSSQDGCLTFVFRSDTAVNNPGWVANVTCSPAPTCRIPTTLVTTTITPSSATFNWTQIQNPDTSIANNWEALLVPTGSPEPTGPGIPISWNTYTTTGLTPNTCYTFYVRAVCSATDSSSWTSINFCTPLEPPTCGGQFVDNGGLNGNYANSSDNTTTICPTNSGEVVTVVFDSFNTEATWDALYVYDGNTLAAPQISSENPIGNVPGGLPGGFWGTTIPGPFISSSPDGCLTFRFRSDPSVNNPGWVANVSCGPAPDRILLAAFVDQNNNGIKEISEPFFSNGSFVYQQNNDGTNINGYSPTGQFSVYDNTPANTYSFSYELQSQYTPYYTSGTTTYSNISIAPGSGTQFLYFPVTLTQAFNDVTIAIAPISVPRPGLTYANKITYRNLGVGAASGTITFAKPPQITTYTVNQTGTVTNTNGFTYAFTNLLPNETRNFDVTMTVPLVPIVNINDLLTDSVSISALADDINLTNNSSSNSQIVVNSFDPNDKMESRGKTIPFNQFAPGDYFIYTIRFQNNGTADAIDVRIEDFLNSQIDETSVLMVSSNHNYTLKRINNQLVWDFKNIYLTPSSVNESGSKGYVQFKVKLKPGFQAGNIIPNNASIYFDTNPAIVTNTFNSKFTIPLGVKSFDANSLILYPNPASNTVQISLMDTNEQLSKVVFYDILGKAVKTVTTVTTKNMTVNVSDLSKGVYLVEIALDNNLKLTKKLIIQ